MYILCKPGCKAYLSQTYWLYIFKDQLGIYYPHQHCRSDFPLDVLSQASFFSWQAAQFYFFHVLASQKSFFCHLTYLQVLTFWGKALPWLFIGMKRMPIQFCTTESVLAPTVIWRMRVIGIQDGYCGLAWPQPATSCRSLFQSDPGWSWTLKTGGESFKLSSVSLDIRDWAVKLRQPLFVWVCNAWFVTSSRYIAQSFIFPRAGMAWEALSNRAIN